MLDGLNSGLYTWATEREMENDMKILERSMRVALAIILALSLASCTSNSNSSDKTPKKTTVEETRPSKKPAESESQPEVTEPSKKPAESESQSVNQSEVEPSVEPEVTEPSELPFEETTIETTGYADLPKPTLVSPSINCECEWISNQVYAIDFAELINEYTDSDDSNYNRYFNIPHLNFDTAYAQEINSKMLGYIKEIDDNKDDFYHSSNYLYYTYGSYITVVFEVVGDWDIVEYYIYNIDMDGNEVSNKQIFEASNSEFDTITDAAFDATSNYVNSAFAVNFNMPFIVDGKINPDLTSMTPDMLQSLYDITFCDTNLNDDMAIGLDYNGDLVFTSDIFSLGGAYYYEQLYAANGADIGSYVNTITYLDSIALGDI